MQFPEKLLPSFLHCETNPLINITNRVNDHPTLCWLFYYKWPDNDNEGVIDLYKSAYNVYINEFEPPDLPCRQCFGFIEML